MGNTIKLLNLDWLTNECKMRTANAKNIFTSSCTNNSYNYKNVSSAPASHSSNIKALCFFWLSFNDDITHPNYPRETKHFERVCDINWIHCNYLAWTILKSIVNSKITVTLQSRLIYMLRDSEKNNSFKCMVTTYEY